MKNFSQDSFNLVAIVTTVLLILACFSLPYGYYRFLRVFVTVVSIWGIFVAINVENAVWLLVFLAAAVLFNPLFPIYLTKSVWRFFNIAAAIIFTLSIFTLKRREID